MLIQYLIYTIIFSYIAYKKTNQNEYILKNICFIYLVGSLITLIFYLFNIYLNIYTCIISILFIKFVYNTLRCYNLKSDKLNKKHLFIAFYKSKSLDMSIKSIGNGLASICFLFCQENNYYFYQFRLGKEYMQKIPLDKNKMDEYLKKYVLINTKYEVKNLESNFEEIILKRRRKTLKGLWRLNCLLSMKETLNKIKGFEVRFYEFLPCIYINRIKNKINNER